MRSFSGLICADIMSSPVVSIASGTTIATVAATLKHHGTQAVAMMKTLIGQTTPAWRAIAARGAGKRP